MRGLGTLVNVAAVLAGTGVGVPAGARLPERMRRTVLDGIGERLRRRARSEDDRFVLGFVTASLTFCVGALTIVGALRDGISRDNQLLIVTSALDGVVSIVYAAAFGWGVAASALTILVVQGGLTGLGAVAGDTFLTTRMVAEIEATGGILIAGIGVRLLELRAIRLGSMLPALVVAPVLVALFAR